MTTVNVKGTNLKKETVKIGSYFVNSDDELYVLARVDGDLCCLISVLGGNRWTDATETNVKINNNEITREDFLKVCAGESFTEVKSVNITYEL